MDSRRTPQGIASTHPPYQRSILRTNLRAAATTALPPPVVPEPLPVPAHDGFWLHDVEGASPTRPDSRNEHPEQPIRIRQSGPWIAKLQHGELFEGRGSQGLTRVGKKRRSQRSNDDPQPLEHVGKTSRIPRENTMESGPANKREGQLRNITAKWKNPPREWHAAKAQFAIQFGDLFVLTV